MPIEDLSRCVYSPGCSSVGTQCSPTPLYENVDNFGEMLQALRSNDMLDSSNQNIASVHSVVKHDIVSSLKSLDDDRRTPYNTVDSRSTIRTKRPIDMRPLSLPMPGSKRRDTVRRRSCICLSIATVAVFGSALAIWFLYDPMEMFIVDVFN
uniref:Membrane protein US8A n=1 Tax=Ascaris lumbricoides TaxID=6252 RepID=A0A0M3IFH7_ASCLU